MLRFTRRLFLSMMGATAVVRGQTRLRRKDCFFGLHFDLHPNNTDKALGRDVTEEMIHRLLDRTRPDYVQYDCKGHVGWVGYPSKVSPAAPGIVKDSLALWRKVTARRGVALFVHFSGVWDTLAVTEHPEWARVKPDGTPDERITSTFGPYVDQRMIPQLREIAANYSIDGAWVDGECWATVPDYNKAAAAKFGTPLPAKPGEPRWQEFLELNRDQFRRYVKHYVDALHETHPEFQIASNWLYTTYVPERPTLPIDFISGDYLGNASMATARLEARYLSAVDKPWDLMAWGFQSARNNAVGPVHKNREHIMQEAAVVLAQGGGFQVYYTPTRTGYFDDKLIDTMASVAKFCRDRQAFSHKTETVPQAGLLFSGHSLYKTANKMFGGWPGQYTAPARGVLAALIENHFPVDVIPDWKLRETMKAYELIVVPDWLDIGTETLQALQSYRGKLVIIGAENARLFGMAGAASDQPAWIVGRDLVGSLRGAWVDNIDGEVIEQRYPTTDTTRDARPAAILKGATVFIPGPFGTAFSQTHAPAARQFLKRVIDRVWKPGIEVEAPPTIELVLRRRGRQTILHLNNATNMQVAGDYATTDFIPPVGPVDIKLKLPDRPRIVRLQPDVTGLQGSWANGTWTGRVPSVHIHSAVVFG